MDTVATQIKIGDRVRWHTCIPYYAFDRRYASDHALVVAVNKNTVHIQVRKRCGTTTLKWVKRNRVSIIIERMWK